MLERQRRKKQRLGQPKVQRVLAATLAFLILDSRIVMELPQALQLLIPNIYSNSRLKDAETTLFMTTAVKFPKVLRRTSPKIQAGPFDVTLKSLGWPRLDDHKWRI